MTETRRISLDLPTDLLDAISTAADERVVGRSLLIEHLLRDGLDRLIPVDQFVRYRHQEAGS